VCRRCCFPLPPAAREQGQTSRPILGFVSPGSRGLEMRCMTCWETMVCLVCAQDSATERCSPSWSEVPVQMLLASVLLVRLQGLSPYPCALALGVDRLACELSSKTLSRVLAFLGLELLRRMLQLPGSHRGKTLGTLCPILGMTDLARAAAASRDGCKDDMCHKAQPRLG